MNNVFGKCSFIVFDLVINNDNPLHFNTKRQPAVFHSQPFKLICRSWTKTLHWITVRSPLLNYFNFIISLHLVFVLLLVHLLFITLLLVRLKNVEQALAQYAISG